MGRLRGHFSPSPPEFGSSEKRKGQAITFGLSRFENLTKAQRYGQLTLLFLSIEKSFHCVSDCNLILFRIIQWNHVIAKGQLILKCLFAVFKSTKSQRNSGKDFCASP